MHLARGKIWICLGLIILVVLILEFLNSNKFSDPYFQNSRFNPETRPEAQPRPELQNSQIDGVQLETKFDDLDFSKGDNETGYDHYVVPNIIHLIKFKDHRITFTELICIRSIYLNQNPDKIIIHCDCDEPTGDYWPMVKFIPGIEVRRMEAPTEIFGRKFSYIQHAADVARIRILRQFGGIYLDSDVYVVSSLNPLRKYEMALCLPPKAYIGNQVLIANKKSRFLKLYYESYHQYDSKLWYYNGGELPTKSIIWKKPWLVHGEPWKLGCDMGIPSKLYKAKPFVRMMDYITIHLFVHHKHLVPDDPVKVFSETNIKNYTRPFGDLARLVLYGQREVVSQNSSIKPLEEVAKLIGFDHSFTNQ